MSPTLQREPTLSITTSHIPVQVDQLRGELMRVQADEQRARVETGQSDLLAFVRTMPDEEMLSLTSQVCTREILHLH